MTPDPERYSKKLNILPDLYKDVRIDWQSRKCCNLFIKNPSFSHSKSNLPDQILKYFVMCAFMCLFLKSTYLLSYVIEKAILAQKSQSN